MPFFCIIGGSRAERVDAARELAARAGGELVPPFPTIRWPFTRSILPTHEFSAPAGVVIEDLHLAFPAGQKPGTRLVLTQSTYQLQRWIDWLDQHPHVSVVAHASRAGLTDGAPESASGRGPWSRIHVRELQGDDGSAPESADAQVVELRRAFRESADARLAIVRAAIASDSANPALWLLLGSVLMEL